VPALQAQGPDSGTAKKKKKKETKIVTYIQAIDREHTIEKSSSAIATEIKISSIGINNKCAKVP
jgi:hypothetical protein